VTAVTLAGEPETAPPPTAAATAEPQATAPATTELEPTAPQAVTRTTIDPNVKEPVCRRHIPTGSRIATQRCEMPQDTLSAKEQASREVMRRDVADMRMQQQMRDQARAQAMAEALRRRQ
jgi:hypothetical protein